MSDQFGKLVGAARSSRKLSQTELAKAMGISQAKVSRIESSETPPNDIRLVAKLARALDIPVSELLPDGFADLTLHAPNQFYAFCPNPLCESNSRKVQKGEPVVSYASGRRYESEEFDFVNFCKSCGSALLKECPGCGKRLAEVGTRFCVACGERIYPVVTQEQWKSIREKLNLYGEDDEDDIPF